MSISRIDLLSELQVYHDRVGRVLEDLRSRRGPAPVYLLEHGLGATDLTRVARIAGELIARDPDVTAPYWQRSGLPLLALTTEVGYEYRGTGTNFWPVLGSRLQAEINHEGRANIAGLFRAAQQYWGTAAPGQSAWERHFPNISWPIANAILPRELHGSLSEALRQVVRAGIHPGDGEVLLEAIRRIAEGYGSRRFDSWLLREALPLEVVRMLLIPGAEGWLDRATIDRLDGDLSRDKLAARALLDARATLRKSGGSPLRIDRARFQLSLDDGGVVAVTIQGPILDQQTQARYAAQLRIRGNRIRALGAASAMPLERFLAGGRLEIPVAWPLPETPLRRGDETTLRGAGPPPELESIPPSPSVVFLVEPGGKSALGLRKGDRVAPDASLLRLDAELRVRPLDPGVQSDADLLRNSGLTVLGAALAPRVWGLPVAGLHNVFAAGFPLLSPVAVDGTPPRLDAETSLPARVRLGATEFALWPATPGEHIVSAGSRAEGLTTPISILERPRGEPVGIVISPPGATVEDLTAGRLEITLRSPITLDGRLVELAVTLADGRSITVADTVDALPGVLAGRAPLLARLSRGLHEAGHDPDAGVWLSVRVPGLAAARHRLKPATRVFRRDEQTGAWLDLRGDGDPQPVPGLVATPDRPLLAPDTAKDEAGSVSLYIPAGQSAEALGCGRVIRHRTRLRLAALQNVVLPGPLLREAASNAEGIGLIPTVTSWLSWRLGSAPDVISNWERRHAADALEQAVVEQLCGKAWRRIEAGMDLDVLTRAACLQSAAQQKLQHSGTELPAINDPRDQRALRDHLTLRFTHALGKASVAAELDDDTVALFDEALDLGWQDLRRQIQRSGRPVFDELDLNLDPADWQAALADADAMPVLPAFAPLMLPVSRREMLRDADYAGMSLSDVVDLLDQCHLDAHRRSGPRRIGRAELRVLAQLWLAPAQLIEDDDWQVLLARCLSDQQTARASRYAALRLMISRHDLPGGDDE